MNICFSCLSGLYHKVQKKNRQSFLFIIALLAASCSISPTDSNKTVSFSSKSADAVVVAQNNEIALAGKKIIENGGNAADAMAAMLATGSVVVPSRMGLGAGGVCQILNPETGRVETLGFLSQPMSFDRKIGTPSLPKGLFRLQNKYGIRPWKEIFTDATYLAKNGITVSSDLAKDIVSTQGLPNEWKKLKKGDLFKQPNLAKTLSTLSQSAVDVLYKGEIAESIVSQSDQIIKEDLKATKIDLTDSIDVSSSTVKTFFANPAILSSDGYTIWKNLQNSQKTDKVSQATEEIQKIQNRTVSAQDSVYGVSLFAADKSGLALACSVSMGNMFGSHQLTQEGFFLATPVHPKDRGIVFLNVLQTNPDVTDIVYTLQGVGNYALSEGLNMMANKQLETNLTDTEKTTSFAEFSCEKGFPSNTSSCKKNQTVHEILVKQDLTK